MRGLYSDRIRGETHVLDCQFLTRLALTTHVMLRCSGLRTFSGALCRLVRLPYRTISETPLLDTLTTRTVDFIADDMSLP